MGKFILAGLLLFGALPATTNYGLNSFTFGNGGGASSTATYALEGSVGEQNGATSSTATYSTKPGFINTQQANVPKLSAFDNGSSTYYNKLHFVIDQQNNPTDATYALSISTDNFASDNRFVKSDLTVGSSLTLTDYQTYTAWGGASGANIIGLLPNTTYYLKVKATQGKYTESGYGPVSSVATVNPSLTFTISTTSINVGNLLTNTVVSAPSTINITFTTNANSGGDVYVNGLNSGLKSSTAGNNTIPSATGDLTSLSHGFGAQVSSVSQLSSVSPYNVSGTNVGVIDTTIRKIMTASSPITAGTASVQLKAKASIADKPATDYTETVTMLASASF